MNPKYAIIFFVLLYIFQCTSPQKNSITPADSSEPPKQDPADSSEPPKQDPADSSEPPKQDPADPSEPPKQDPADSSEPPKQTLADSSEPPLTRLDIDFDGHCVIPNTTSRSQCPDNHINSGTTEVIQDGSQSNPYTIVDIYEFQSIDTETPFCNSYLDRNNDCDCEDDVDRDISNNPHHFEIINDIDASVTRPWNEGQGFIPIRTESGHVLNGNNHTISCLYINNTNASLYNTNATISNLTLSYANIQGDYAAGFNYISVSSSLRNVHLRSSSIQGQDISGGIVGENYYSSIESASVIDSNVLALSNERFGFLNLRNRSVGGIVGINMRGTNSLKGSITNSYVYHSYLYTNSFALSNTCAITSSFIGGIVGTTEQYSLVQNSFTINTGIEIEGCGYAGGIVGDQNGATIENVYAYNTHIYGRGIQGSLVGLQRDSRFVGVNLLNSYSYKSNKNNIIAGRNGALDFQISNTFNTNIKSLDASSTSWNEAIWDFGTSIELPVLKGHILTESNQRALFTNE